MKSSSRSGSQGGSQNAERRVEPVSVILDRGASASVVAIEADVAPGYIFTHDDRDWIVVTYRKHARAFVAVPVKPPVEAIRTSPRDSKQTQPDPCCELPATA